MQCKIRIIKPLEGVFLEYQPEVGKIYDADYTPGDRQKNGNGHSEFCVIVVKDKKIILRRGEFEVVED